MKLRKRPVWAGKARERLIRILALKAGIRCWYCGANLEYAEKCIDHIVPFSKGGSDDLDNLALSCRFCNMAKLDRSLHEFLDWLEWVKSPQSRPTITDGER